jgi:phosphoglycerol transferase MdoB-like AlkP superfamily enzyme
MTWIERLWKCGNDHQIGFVGGLILPAFLGLVVLRGIRIGRHGLPEPVWLLPDLFRPMTLFWAGLGVLGCVYLGLSDEWRANRQRLVFLQLLVVPVVVLEVLGHALFVSTGASLDATLFFRGLLVLKNQPDILWSEARPSYLAALAVLGGMATALPWATTWWRLRSERSGASDTSESSSLWRPLLMASLLLGTSFVPSFATGEAWWSRPSTVNFAVGLVRDFQETWTPRNPVEMPAASLELRRQSGGEAEEGPDNVAIVLLESVRARSTTVHEPDLETTPYLAEWAEQSIVAERAYAVVPHTSKALVAMLCGVEPSLRMELDAVRRGIRARCLPELLGRQGYRTTFFQAATDRFEDRSTLLEHMGYDRFRPLETMDPRGFEAVNYFGLEDNVMLEPNRRWLERRRKSSTPFLATYLTVTPHHPYTLPDTYERRTFVEPADGRLNRYLNTIYYLDRFVEKLVDQYKELGLYEETLFVIASDHGEAFGEHGHYHHDSVVYEEGIRTLLMVHDPSDRRHRLVEPNVTQLDIVPTVVDRLGFEATAGAFRGQSIDRLTEERPIYASCYFERRCMTRIVGSKKYLYQFDKAPDAFYDLAEDPMERHNVIERRDDVDTWRRALLEWRRRINAAYLADEPE